MGWIFMTRLQEYMESPMLSDGLDLVEQLKEAFIKCRPASPLCLILQCPEMVSLILRNSFLSINDAESQQEANEPKETDSKKAEKFRDILMGDDDDIFMHDEAMSPEEVRKELELPWREVCFLLIDSGIHFNGFYKEKQILPIFDQLMKHSDLYLPQLLEPFFGLYAPMAANTEAKEEETEGQAHQYPVKKIRTTVGEITPFGKARLCSVKFVSVLVKAQNEIGIEDLLMKELVVPNHTTTPTISLLRCAIESFFAFRWNNVLHCHIVEIVQEIFATPSIEGEEDGEGFHDNFGRRATPLERYLLEECRLLDAILKVHQEEDAEDRKQEEEEEEARTGGKEEKHKKGRAPRRGNLGHITEISNALVERGDSLFQEFFNKGEKEESERHWPEVLEQWRQFVEGKLKLINEAENATFFKPKAFYAHNYWSF